MSAAVAAQRTEDVAGETLAVHADQHAFVAASGSGDITHHQRQVFGAVENRPERHRPELPELGGHRRFGDQFDERFGRGAIPHQIRDVQHR